MGELTPERIEYMRRNGASPYGVADLLAEIERLGGHTDGRSPQAEHLRLIAKDLRSAGDVPIVELSEDGVTRSYVTLADELWLVALQLDGQLDVTPGVAAPEGGDDAT